MSIFGVRIGSDSVDYFDCIPHPVTGVPAIEMSATPLEGREKGERENDGN